MTDSTTKPEHEGPKCNCPAGSNPRWVGEHYESCWTHPKAAQWWPLYQRALRAESELAAERARVRELEAQRVRVTAVVDTCCATWRGFAAAESRDGSANAYEACASRLECEYNLETDGAPQQPAPPPAEQARLCATCKAPECPRSVLGPDTYCDGYKRAPAEQATEDVPPRIKCKRCRESIVSFQVCELANGNKPYCIDCERHLRLSPAKQAVVADSATTDGGGASPGEAEETVTHGQAREWVEALFAGAPWGTDLHSYIDQQAQVESGLKHAVDDAVATLNKVETERDELRRKLGQTKLDFANACDRGRRLEAKLEAAEAELPHLREANGNALKYWSTRARELEARLKSSPSTAARSGSVGGEAAAAGEEKPWPQVGDVARLVSADSDITRSALRNEHLIGLAIGDEGTVSSLDDDCCNLLAGDGLTWTVATRDIRPSCLSAPMERAAHEEPQPKPLTLADVDRRIAEERAVLVAAMRRVGATGPAALERLADELAEAAEAGKP